MGKKVVESIQHFHTEAGLSVRVWREEALDYDPDHWASPDADLIGAAEACVAPTMRAVAEAVLKLDRVSTVEVKNMEQRGLVVYKDWP